MFDKQFYLDINKARWEVAHSVLRTLKTDARISIETCLDIGCGPGWFAKRIAEMGIVVQGVDGRLHLIEEARKRCYSAQFSCLNIEDTAKLLSLAPADLVFCFGILYHVENPFLLLRNLYSLTKQILLIESIFIPSDYPCAWLVDESKNETQGLSYHSFLLSNSALVAILKRIGFENIYQYQGRIDHRDFVENKQIQARRAILLASHAKMEIDQFEACSQVDLPKFDFTQKVILKAFNRE
jgi:SAM-dependent methyltransferase